MEWFHISIYLEEDSLKVSTIMSAFLVYHRVQDCPAIKISLIILTTNDAMLQVNIANILNSKDERC